MMLLTKPFYFLRHGETDYNRKRIFMGNIDVPLNKTGLQQAAAAAEKMACLRFDYITSSPLQRACETAKIISYRTGKPLRIVEGLREPCLGIVEGQPKEEGALKKWVNGEYIFPGGELFSEFSARIEKALAESTNSQGVPLIVAHNGTYMGIKELLGLPPGSIPNCTPVFHSPPNGTSATWVVHNC